MARFPKGLAHLVPLDVTGRVDGIVVRPRRRAPVVAVQEWDLHGAADHARSTKRAVTLISAEHVEAIAATLGEQAIDWRQLRRNVLIRGLNVNSLRGRTFAIGDQVVLEGTGPCDPCSRMPEILGPGGYAAMLGIGGVCAAIVTPGTIRVGDTLRLLPLETDAAS